MRIVVLGSRGFPNIQGGVEKHCEELYPRLAALGCDVTVIGRAPYTGKEAYQYKCVKIFPIDCPKNKFLEAFVHTFLGIFTAKKLKADILHIHAIGPSLFVPLARMLGLKVVMTNHGPDYDRKKWNTLGKAVLKLGETWGARYANHVIAISKGIAATCRRLSTNVSLIPNGVTVTQRVRANGTLEKFGLQEEKYILAVGRFVPEKGFGDLLESFRQLPSADEYKLVIAGDADHEDEFSRELKQKGKAATNVVLTGFMNEKPLKELYSNARLFILPSYHEGLPIVLLEALSYGNSCLVSDIPANRELALEEARYFKPGNVNLMSQRINEYLNTPVSEEKRKTQIHEIKERYDWSKIAKETFRVYQRILS